MSGHRWGIVEGTVEGIVEGTVEDDGNESQIRSKVSKLSFEVREEVLTEEMLEGPGLERGHLQYRQAARIQPNDC